MHRRLHALDLLLLTGLALPASARSQEGNLQAPVIDTVVIVRENVFTPEEAQSSGVFRTMNKLHVVSHPYVIRRELLFKQGEPYDSLRVAETVRNLLDLAIFTSVDIDTARIHDKLAVVVRTQDGWSTKPRFKFAVASDGSTTLTIGITEVNLLGTGNLAAIAFTKGPDRSGLELIGNLPRLFGNALSASGAYYNLSDGQNGFWSFGGPARSYLDIRSLMYYGVAANQRTLQYFVEDPSMPDTTFFQRLAFNNRAVGILAPKAETSRYLRLGLRAGIRDEQYILQRDTGLNIPDTVSAEIGGFAEYSRSRFEHTSRFNGIGQENLDLSTTVQFFLNWSTPAFDYQRTGIAPGINATASVPFASGFLWGSLYANGLFDGAALDSGRVVANLAFGNKPGPRWATVLQIQAGIQENPPPGQEFDLGFENPPRSWPPHSFVGTRTIVGLFEQRWYVWDKLLNLVGVGLAGFLDYGGAWYEGQDPRFGGNVGVGIRLGSALSTVPKAGRLDLGYRFGQGVTGDRWVISFGTGFVVPWKKPLTFPQPWDIIPIAATTPRY